MAPTHLLRRWGHFLLPSHCSRYCYCATPKIRFYDAKTGKLLPTKGNTKMTFDFTR